VSYDDRLAKVCNLFSLPQSLLLERAAAGVDINHAAHLFAWRLFADEHYGAQVLALSSRDEREYGLVPDMRDYLSARLEDERAARHILKDRRLGERTYPSSGDFASVLKSFVVFNGNATYAIPVGLYHAWEWRIGEVDWEANNRALRNELWGWMQRTFLDVLTPPSSGQQLALWDMETT